MTARDAAGASTRSHARAARRLKANGAIGAASLKRWRPYSKEEALSREHLIERYVARTASKLPFGRQMRKRIAAEITDYLVESTDAYEETGLSRREAERRAVEAFGPPYVVARGFAESRGVRAMATRFACGACVPGVRNDERLALVQRAKISSLLFLTHSDLLLDGPKDHGAQPVW